MKLSRMMKLLILNDEVCIFNFQSATFMKSHRNARELDSFALFRGYINYNQSCREKSARRLIV